MSNGRPTRRRALPLYLRSEDLEIDIPESLRTSPETEGVGSRCASASRASAPAPEKREDAESPIPPLWSPFTPVARSESGRSEDDDIARARRGADTHGNRESRRPKAVDGRRDSMKRSQGRHTTDTSNESEEHQAFEGTQKYRQKTSAKAKSKERSLKVPKATRVRPRPTSKLTREQKEILAEREIEVRMREMRLRTAQGTPAAFPSLPTDRSVDSFVNVAEPGTPSHPNCHCPDFDHYVFCPNYEDEATRLAREDGFDQEDDSEPESDPYSKLLGELEDYPPTMAQDSVNMTNRFGEELMRDLCSVKPQKYREPGSDQVWPDAMVKLWEIDVRMCVTLVENMIDDGGWDFDGLMGTLLFPESQCQRLYKHRVALNKERTAGVEQKPFLGAEVEGEWIDSYNVYTAKAYREGIAFLKSWGLTSEYMPPCQPPISEQPLVTGHLSGPPSRDGEGPPYHDRVTALRGSRDVVRPSVEGTANHTSVSSRKRARDAPEASVSAQGADSRETNAPTAAIAPPRRPKKKPKKPQSQHGPNLNSLSSQETSRTQDRNHSQVLAVSEIQLDTQRARTGGTNDGQSSRVSTSRGLSMQSITIVNAAQAAGLVRADMRDRTDTFSRDPVATESKHSPFILHHTGELKQQRTGLNTPFQQQVSHSSPSQVPPLSTLSVSKLASPKFQLPAPRAKASGSQHSIGPDRISRDYLTTTKRSKQMPTDNPRYLLPQTVIPREIGTVLMPSQISERSSVDLPDPKTRGLALGKAKAKTTNVQSVTPATQCQPVHNVRNTETSSVRPDHSPRLTGQDAAGLIQLSDSAKFSTTQSSSAAPVAPMLTQSESRGVQNFSNEKAEQKVLLDTTEPMTDGSDIAAANASTKSRSSVKFVKKNPKIQAKRRELHQSPPQFPSHSKNPPNSIQSAIAASPASSVEDSIEVLSRAPRSMNLIDRLAGANILSHNHGEIDARARRVASNISNVVGRSEPKVA